VDAESGLPRWQFETGPLHAWAWGMEGWDVYLSSPVVVDGEPGAEDGVGGGGVVVFGAGDGSIYALDLGTGQERWRFTTEGRIRSTPAVADGIVFAGSADGVVYALALSDGTEQWRHETEGVSFDSGQFGFDRRSIIASPAIVDGTVYVGSRDGFMYALDQATGTRKWRVSHQVSWAMSSPSIVGDALIAGTSDGAFLHRVDVTTGEEVWRFQAEGYTWSSPALAGSTAYIGDGAGYLWAVDAETGTERWSFRTGGGVYSSPWVADGTVYFGADDGAVYAVGEGSPARYRAAYWPEGPDQPGVAAPSSATRARFEQAGYEVLDAAGLAAFFQARVSDGARSVTVFAAEEVPSTVATEPSDTVLFRRYLDAGGKVVWLGPPPMSFVRNEAGQISAVDQERPAGLLDVDYTESKWDFYGSMPTDLGRTWGLDGGWLSSHAVTADQDIEVLALDEIGMAGAWVKSFGGPAGTGFVGLGLHAANPRALEAALTVAEFGMGLGIHSRR